MTWVHKVLNDLKKDYEEGDFYGSINLTADLLYTIEHHPEYKKHKDGVITSDDILRMFIYNHL